MKITKEQLRQIIREEIRKATLSESTPLAKKWQDNNKKGFRLKAGDIDLVSGGPGGEHQILKNGKRIGSFGYDSNADDWSVTPIGGKQFFAREIDDIVKKLSVNEREVAEAKAKKLPFGFGDFVHLKSKNETGMVMSIKGNQVTIRTMKGTATGDVKDVMLLAQDGVKHTTPIAKEGYEHISKNPGRVEDQTEASEYTNDGSDIYNRKSGKKVVVKAGK